MQWIGMQARFDTVMDNAWVMELDSLAEEKFSRHIIIRIPGKAFAHNIHVGALVKQICQAAKQAETAQGRLEVVKASL